MFITSLKDNKSPSIDDSDKNVPIILKEDYSGANFKTPDQEGRASVTRVDSANQEEINKHINFELSNP